MAVATTGAIYKSLSFDGVESRNFGVYITGEAVYNAPARNVEMISIPGRSGAFALDKGRFENVEVTYPAGIFADNETDFANAISDFRNYLCSRKGYCRLVDEYNPEEYRMAIYKSGLEVTPAQLKAGEFNIVFDCKPQRYLMSGETEITVADGEEITNPTRFESSPLLKVEGYGTIGFNDYAIELDNATMGSITLANQKVFTDAGTTIDLLLSYMNSGDTIEIMRSTYAWKLRGTGSSVSGLGIASWSDSQPDVSTHPGIPIPYTTIPLVSFQYGTSGSYTNTTTINGSYYQTSWVSYTAYIITTISYDGDETITITRTTSGFPAQVAVSFDIGTSTVGEVVGDSTTPALGHPTYIDCDLGETYSIDSGGNVYSLDRAVDLGSSLPKLGIGTNVISYDDTITELKITPRWWKV